MKALVAVVSVLLFAGCPPKPPTPSPSPSPSPTPSPIAGRPTDPVYTDLVLRQTDGRLHLNESTVPFKLIGAIPCWPETDDPGSLKVDGVVVDYDWPLVSKTWMDAVKPKGVNAAHIRLGPARASEQCCGLEAIGGPYAETPVQALRRVKRQARRLEPQWNETYWASVHDRLRHAGEKGFVIEVDVLDGWLVKHSIWGDASMPWPSEDVHGASKVPLNPSLTAWVRKVVWETCPYGNVIYQISNESEGIPGWTSTWERAMLNLIRQTEQEEGCAGRVIHMVGSNTRDYDGPYDYFTAHDSAIPEGPVAGRPIMVNEYNPHLTPASFQYAFCSAQEAGQTFWYWRSDGSDADQDASLNALNCAAPAPNTCPSPLPPKDNLIFAIKCGDNGICDITPQVTKECEFCAAIGMGEYNGQIRCTCPMRNECGPTGHPNPNDPSSFQCDKRLACEQYVMERPAPKVNSDAAWPIDAAGFRWKCDGTWIEACDNSGAHCTRVDCK